MQRLLLLLSLSASLVFAQGVTSLPHIAVGGGWKTIFTVVNLSDLPGAGELRFHAEDGTPLPVTLTTSNGLNVMSTSISVLPHGMQTFETTVNTGTVTSGWAEFVPDPSTAPLSISAVFRRQVNSNSTFEASVPSTPNATRPLIIPFDNTSGSSTGVALVNPSPVQAAAIPVTIRAINGSVIQIDVINLNPGSHMSFDVASRYISTPNGIGTIEFDPDLTGGGLNVVALRFNPTGSFTTVQPIIRQ